MLVCVLIFMILVTMVLCIHAVRLRHASCSDLIFGNESILCVRGAEVVIKIVVAVIVVVVRDSDNLNVMRVCVCVCM